MQFAFEIYFAYILSLYNKIYCIKIASFTKSDATNSQLLIAQKEPMEI